METKLKNYRIDFPSYMGFIPFKKEIIGQTIGATNNTIKSMLSHEPPSEEIIIPVQQYDFTQYHKDYYTDKFYKGYPLEEDNITSNNSRDAKTWVGGSKFEIYPQHIPGRSCLCLITRIYFI